MQHVDKPGALKERKKTNGNWTNKKRYLDSISLSEQSERLFFPLPNSHLFWHGPSYMSIIPCTTDDIIAAVTALLPYLFFLIFPCAFLRRTLCLCARLFPLHPGLRTEVGDRVGLGEPAQRRRWRLVAAYTSALPFAQGCCGRVPRDAPPLVQW